MYSYIFASIVTLVYLLFSLEIHKKLKGTKSSLSALKKMLRYSVPLIPNALLWWIATASNKYFVLAYLGASMNGLYAVATKIPTLLSAFSGIFFQAWQISAIEEAKSSDISFTNSVINALASMLTGGASFILVIGKPLMKAIFNVAYSDAWVYVPYLLLSVVFQTYASIYGTVYISYKQTSGILVSTTLGAIVNIIGNFLLMPMWGLQAASFTTMVSFLFILLYRIWGTRKFVKIKPNYKLLIVSTIVLSIQAFISTTNHNTLPQYAFFILLFLITAPQNCKLLRSIVKQGRR
jgi:O-antigen/teichoic acid export membrane protein